MIPLKYLWIGIAFLGLISLAGAMGSHHQECHKAMHPGEEHHMECPHGANITGMYCPHQERCPYAGSMETACPIQGSSESIRASHDSIPRFPGFELLLSLGALVGLVYLIKKR